MKKVLTIYVDDDAELNGYCASFLCFRPNGDSSTTMQVAKLNGNNALYLPWKIEENEPVHLFREEGDLNCS